MPHQLIYTTAASAAPAAADPDAACELATRSAKIPPALAQRLVELSTTRHSAEPGIAGAEYSYRIEELGGCIYHLLSSARSTPDGQFLLQHHLALSQQEVHELCHSCACTTPAGVALALEQHHYWQSAATGGEVTLAAPPPLTPTPGTEGYPTWRFFTGSADNARALHHEPYRQGCVLLVPPGTQSRDLLRLLHESQALSPTLGWGIPFSTCASPAEPPHPARYTCTTPGSTLHRRARQSSCPVLHLAPGLSLPAPDAPQQPAPQASTPPAEITLPPRPYFYCESTDTDTFTPRPHSRQTPR
ncbi:MAG: hypothetical protein J1E42_04280 [Akkermansiaceae bacterium]|nr:hypothetical protein [Akkermansiaceae bacterium]